MTRNANRMQEAVDHLMARFGQAASVTISYTRGDMTIVGLAATVGRTPFEVMDGDVLTAYESRDYLIAKDDLASGGLQLVPESGDLIADADGRVYVVSVPKPMHVYESIGPFSSVYKIHTKAIA